MAQKRHLRKSAIAVIVLLLLAALAGTVIGIRTYQHQRERRETEDSLSVTVNEEKLKVPYQSEFNASDLILSSEGQAEIKGTVDTGKTGDYPITVTVSKTTSYGEVVSKVFDYTVTVFDDIPPEIELAEEIVEFHTGEEYDLNQNVLSVTDTKDGELSYSETLREGTYMIESAFDSEMPGEYTAAVKAEDLDGNTADKSFTVIVTDAREDLNPYRIMINRALNTVTVYAPDSKGEYTLPVMAMVCSTGPATPAGVFHTFNRSAWRALFGGVYGQYATDIVGDILFHSVPYYSMNKADLEYLEYNKLGTKASMGCIRLPVEDALWIFNNCPIGTEVEIYDDSDNPGPLGKPQSIYIDPESEIRGWDPTDPDPQNPWKW